MIILFTWIILINSFVPTRAVGCCSRVTNEACKRSCQQLQELPSTVPRMQFLLTAAETCPAHLTEFWNCINNSLLDVQQMSDWPGKPCCDMARSRECRKHCSSADTKDGIIRYCREKDEPSLYSCIKNQEDGSQCCGKAKSKSCSLVCQGIYLTGVGNTRATRETLAQHCRRKDRRVAQCVHRKWKPPEGSVHDMPCCDTAPTSHCRSRCRSILRTFMSENDRIDELSKACSVPQLTDPFWQCFLIKHKSRRNETMPVTRFDNAKLQCCGKAASSRCRELCTQTYKKGWTYDAEFETSCSYMQPVSTMETQMNNCLIDVDQPCKLGCSGLQFCSNFNNRPTEAFRSCSPESDRAAALAYQSWKDGVIHLPQLNIFVKDITKCKPFMWKAIACALEIQPCSSTQSVMTLCKEDCMYILSWCVDPSKLSGEQTVPVLCNALPSKTIPGSCVPLDPYLTESPTTAMTKNEVTHPCNPNPCMPNEICLLRKRKCKHATDCLPYVCQGACPLGQVSKVLAPKGTALRLINVNADSSKGEDCYLACQCTHHGKIENCQPMHCVKKQSCKLSIDNIKGHGEQFTLDGRQCLCNAGEIICSQTSCRPDAFSPFYSGIHGNCPMHYNPICGDNGKTYPSRCVAKCAGISNMIGNKACSDIDMCADKPCPTGFRCVPRPQVCLNNLTSSGPCRQYECVEEMGECNVHHHDPVCDTHGNEFNNMCILYSHRKTMGYRGHCQKFCSSTGVVCGHDGETYSSECAAKAARVTVDYHTRCQAFGNFTSDSKSVSCSRVQCPPLSPNNCQGIIPPGGCCPICASQMLLLWDPHFVEAAAKHSKTRLLSSMDVLITLSSHMTILECDIFGFVSISSELVVIVAPTISQPSALQVQACQSEAKRIYNLIRSESPNIMSYLNVSPLLVVSLELSAIKHPVLSDSTFISDPLHTESSSSGNGNSASQVTLSFSALWLFLLAWLIVHRTCNLRL